MTNQEKVLEYVRIHPLSTNTEIAESTDIDTSVVKTYINRLKTKGFINVQMDGVTRNITVVKELPVPKNIYKQEILHDLLEVYIEDIKETIGIQEKIERGKFIEKL